MSIWYEKFSQYLIEANSYFYSLYDRVRNDPEFARFMKEYNRETLSQFIFESNNIEREGLPEGQTKKLVLAHHGNSIAEELFNDLAEVSTDVIPKRKLKKFNAKNFTPVISFRGKKKDVRTTLNHYIAILEMQVRVYETIGGTLKAIVKIKKNSPKLFDYFLKNWKDVTSSIRIQILNKLLKSEQSFIDEKFIKTLHSHLADGFPNNNNGLPGEYRPEPSMVDLKTFFIEPSLIPGAMKVLVGEHKKRINGKHYNLFLEAAKLSEDIVKIHPFGDYNGRLSRIILNCVLAVDGVPFFLVLRSTSRDRKKYFTSMKHAYRGKHTSNIALICKCFLDQIESINSRLRASGKNELEKLELPEKELFNLGINLEYYLKNNWSYK